MDNPNIQAKPNPTNANNFTRPGWRVFLLSLSKPPVIQLSRLLGLRLFKSSYYYAEYYGIWYIMAIWTHLWITNSNSPNDTKGYISRKKCYIFGAKMHVLLKQRLIVYIWYACLYIHHEKENKYEYVCEKVIFQNDVECMNCATILKRNIPIEFMLLKVSCF